MAPDFTEIDQLIARQASDREIREHGFHEGYSAGRLSILGPMIVMGVLYSPLSCLPGNISALGSCYI